jgi:hypothetical protein
VIPVGGTQQKKIMPSSASRQCDFYFRPACKLRLRWPEIKIPHR